MKIGIVTTWFERGAAYVSKLYKELLDDDHDVYIYARGGEEYAIGDSIWDKEYVHWGKKYPMPEHHTYIDKRDFTNWIKKNNIEVVLFNEQRWWQSIKICKELNVKVGAYIDYYTDSTLDLFGLYDFLICNTKRHFSAMSWHKQAYYVPWGTDVHLFSPKEDVYQKNIKSKKIVFFHSAGMSPFRKGTDFTIKAFKKLIDENIKCKLIIHTQVKLENFFPELNHLIEELINGGHLEIILKTVSAPGLYYLGDVYVYPSRIEGIGLTIAEAIASGLPTITVNNGPMNEFISEPSQVAAVEKYYSRSDGYYWPICEVNIEELVAKMKFFVSNKDMLEEYKVQTRKYALANLDWGKNKDLVKEIFEKSVILPVENSIVKKIDKKDTSIYPLLIQYPKVYSYLTRLFKLIRKKTL